LNPDLLANIGSDESVVAGPLKIKDFLFFGENSLEVINIMNTDRSSVARGGFPIRPFFELTDDQLRKNILGEIKQGVSIKALIQPLAPGYLNNENILKPNPAAWAFAGQASGQMPPNIGHRLFIQGQSGTVPNWTRYELDLYNYILKQFETRNMSDSLDNILLITHFIKLIMIKSAMNIYEKIPADTDNYGEIRSTGDSFVTDTKEVKDAKKAAEIEINDEGKRKREYIIQDGMVDTLSERIPEMVQPLNATDALFKWTASFEQWLQDDTKGDYNKLSDLLENVSYKLIKEYNQDNLVPIFKKILENKKVFGENLDSNKELRGQLSALIIAGQADKAKQALGQGSQLGLADGKATQDLGLGEAERFKAAVRAEEQRAQTSQGGGEKRRTFRQSLLRNNSSKQKGGSRTLKKNRQRNNRRRIRTVRR
jgi:hypothetical protein